jgi:tetrahydromethanopterin S-methyltransferase subunit G
MSDENPQERRQVDLALDNLRRETDYRFDTVSQRFVAAEAAVGVALATAKEAMVLANLANEKRFDALAEKIDVLTTSMNTLAGQKQGISASVGYMLGGATVFLTLVVIVANYTFGK